MKNQLRKLTEQILVNTAKELDNQEKIKIIEEQFENKGPLELYVRDVDITNIENMMEASQRSKERKKWRRKVTIEKGISNPSILAAVKKELGVNTLANLSRGQIEPVVLRHRRAWKKAQRSNNAYSGSNPIASRYDPDMQNPGAVVESIREHLISKGIWDLSEQRRTSVIGINPTQIRNASHFMSSLPSNVRNKFNFVQTGKRIHVVSKRTGGKITTIPQGTMGVKTTYTASSAMQAHLLDDPDWTPGRNERAGFKSTLRRGSPGSTSEYTPEPVERAAPVKKPVDKEKLRKLSAIVKNRGMKEKRRKRIEKAISKMQARA